MARPTRAESAQAEAEFGRDAQGHDPYAIHVKTCKIPGGRRSVVFAVRFCKDCGKQSVNGGPFLDLFATDEVMWSEFESDYRRQHPRSRSALEHKFLEIRTWLSPGVSILYPFPC
jgi:hypothetical protein